MRRSAWKQWRSCSQASETKWADSLASHALAGWIRSPSASSTLVTGCWASQSIATSGRSRLSSLATATSRRACPSPIGDEIYSARLGRLRPRVQTCRAHGLPLDAVDEPLDQPVDLDRLTPVGQVAGALQHHQLATGQLGQALAFRQRLAPVLRAVDHEQGAANAPAQRFGRVRVRWRGPPLPLGDHGLGIGLEGPRDRVLVLLGGVRLR